MNNFCSSLEESLRCNFKIDVRIFVSEKKKVRRFFNDMIRYIREYWNRGKFFYPRYF